MTTIEARHTAARIFRAMSDEQRGRMMDQLVLDCFDWMDWFDDRPPANVLRILFQLLESWEQ